MACTAALSLDELESQDRAKSARDCPFDLKSRSPRDHLNLEMSEHAARML